MKPIRGRPRKLGDRELREMRAEWGRRTTSYWAHRFNVGEATVMSTARRHRFPARPKGPRGFHAGRLVVQDYAGPVPKKFRCPRCLAIYRKRCPNGH
jgi:hypothetical protein